jgi:hypothetical protein
MEACYKVAMKPQSNVVDNGDLKFNMIITIR